MLSGKTCPFIAALRNSVFRIKGPDSNSKQMRPICLLAFPRFFVAAEDNNHQVRGRILAAVAHIVLVLEVRIALEARTALDHLDTALDLVADCSIPSGAQVGSIVAAGPVEESLDRSHRLGKAILAGRRRLVLDFLGRRRRIRRWRCVFVRHCWSSSFRVADLVLGL